MNRDEWYKNSRTGDRTNGYYKTCHKAYQQWRRQNGYTCKCVVHHRIDTEEARKYNEEHYERWGCSEDGTFEHGKYVIFMTNAEHNALHKLGTHHTEITKKKLSKALKGRVVSSETRLKLSKLTTGSRNPMYTIHWTDSQKSSSSVKHKIIMRGIKVLYNVYKDNNGKLSWNDFQKSLKDGSIAFEVRPNSVLLVV